MIHQFNFFFCLALILLLNPKTSFSRVHDYETARLKSTGGTGVGSILMDEASLLNPASIAFYNISSIYASRHTTKFSEASQETNFIPPKNPSYGTVLSDAKNNLKGSLSITKQREWDHKRFRTAFSLAAPIGPYSSMGFTFRKTKDQDKEYNNTIHKRKYNQLIIGATHAVKPEFSLGMVLIDPFKANKEDTFFILGQQLSIYKIIILMFDIGSDYNEDLGKSLMYRGALQFNFVSDLYVRVGAFNNKKLREKGSGFGLGWVTPNFIADLGLKTTTQNYSLEKLMRRGYPPQKFTELSFGLGVKF